MQSARAESRLLTGHAATGYRLVATDRDDNLWVLDLDKRLAAELCGTTLYASPGAANR